MPSSLLQSALPTSTPQLCGELPVFEGEITIIAPRLRLDEVHRLVQDYVNQVSPSIRVHLILLRDTPENHELPPRVRVTTLKDLEAQEPLLAHAPVHPDARVLFQLRVIGAHVAASSSRVCLTVMLSSSQCRALRLGGAYVVALCHNGKDSYTKESVDRLIAVSGLVYKQLRDQGVRAFLDTVRYIPHTEASPSSMRNQLRRAWGISAEAEVIGMIGSIRPQRDHVKALHVFKEYLETRDAYLVIIGDPVFGKLGDTALRELADTIEQLGLQLRVRILPTPTHPTAYLAGCSVLLHTSRYEGWDYAICDALSLGVPVVTYNIAGNAELYAQGLFLLSKYATQKDWVEVLMRAVRTPVHAPVWKNFPSYRLLTLAGMAYEYTPAHHAVHITGALDAPQDVDDLVNLILQTHTHTKIELIVCATRIPEKLVRICEMYNVAVWYFPQGIDPFECTERMMAHMVQERVRVVSLFRVPPRIEALLLKAFRWLPLQIIRMRSIEAPTARDPRLRHFRMVLGPTLSEQGTQEEEDGLLPPHDAWGPRMHSRQYAEAIRSALGHTRTVATPPPQETPGAPLRVLFFLWQFPTPSEVFVLNQIVGLIRRGHHVDIYAMGGIYPDTAAVSRPLIKQYRLMERLVVPVSHTQFSLSYALPKWVNMRFAPLRVLDWCRRYIGVQKIHEGDKVPFASRTYDIIHCQFGTMTDTALRYRRYKWIQGKIITTFQGKDISEHVVERGRDVYQKAFAEGDMFLGVSRAFRDRAIELGCPKQKVAVHRSGIDLSLFPYRTPLYPIDGVVRFVTTGRFVEKKGIAYAIRAASELRKTHPHFRYTIIGDGPLRQEFEDLIASLDIASHIEIIDWKNHKDMVAHLRRAHIFVAPCVVAESGDVDGIPNTLVEAMALGLPVITTQHASISDLVIPGMTGSVVPQRDVTALARAMRDMMNHPTTWEPLARKARACVEREADSEVLNDQLVEIYRKLASSS